MEPLFTGVQSACLGSGGLWTLLLKGAVVLLDNGVLLTLWGVWLLFLSFHLGTLSFTCWTTSCKWHAAVTLVTTGLDACTPAKGACFLS